MMGWKYAQQAIFRTDYDVPSDVILLADRFRSVDKLSLTKNHKTLTLELMNSDIGWIALLVEKIPIINDKGNITGIYAQAIDTLNTSLFKYSQMLSEVDQKIIPSNKKSAIYMLNSEHSPIQLPIHQQECLFFLIRGKTIEQIAKIFNLSIHIVESYIEYIQHKLGCTNTSQIVEKAIDSGFLYYIPENLLKQNIGVINENTTTN